jgi:hypothetical protein
MLSVCGFNAARARVDQHENSPLMGSLAWLAGTAQGLVVLKGPTDAIVPDRALFEAICQGSAPAAAKLGSVRGDALWNRFWRPHTDASSGKEYYVHALSHQVAWDLPHEAAKPQTPAHAHKRPKRSKR